MTKEHAHHSMKGIVIIAMGSLIPTTKDYHATDIQDLIYRVRTKHCIMQVHVHSECLCGGFKHGIPIPD